MQILKNLKAINSCEVPPNDTFSYRPMQITKKSGKCKFGLRNGRKRSRENTRLIAISPLDHVHCP